MVLADYDGVFALPAQAIDLLTDNGIEVVYVDTVRNSSSKILRDWTATDD